MPSWNIADFIYYLKNTIAIKILGQIHATFSTSVSSALICNIKHIYAWLDKSWIKFSCRRFRKSSSEYMVFFPEFCRYGLNTDIWSLFLKDNHITWEITGCMRACAYRCVTYFFRIYRHSNGLLRSTRTRET